MIFETATEFSDAVESMGGLSLRVVATSGAFDILHKGHLKMLHLCQTLGGVVVVLLNTDKSIRSYKSEHHPLKPWKERAALLDEMESVDYVVGLHADDPRNALEIIKPDVWVKGDRPISEVIERDVCLDNDCDIVILWNSQAGSSSDYIEKAAQIYTAELEA